MPSYLKAKSGMGGSLRNQMRMESVSATNKVGRAWNTTTKQAYINALVQGTNMNFEGTREYNMGSLLTGGAQSAAGE